MSDTPETDSLLRGDDTRWSASMVKRLKTLENALKILMGDVDHLGHWIPDPCRRLVDDALANDKNQPTSDQWVNSVHSCHNECARPLCVLRRERDEARNDVRDLMEQYQDHLKYGDEFEDPELIKAISDRLNEWETKLNV